MHIHETIQAAHVAMFRASDCERCDEAARLTTRYTKDRTACTFEVDCPGCGLSGGAFGSYVDAIDSWAGMADELVERAEFEKMRRRIFEKRWIRSKVIS